MRISRTAVTLDTCGCKLEYEFDADEPEATRVHTPYQVLHACAVHLPVYDPNNILTLFVAALGENNAKNDTLGALLESLPPEDKIETTDKEGNVSVSFKVEPTISYDAERVLTVEHPSLAAVKADVETKLVERLNGAFTDWDFTDGEGEQAKSPILDDTKTQDIKLGSDAVEGISDVASK